MHHFLGASLHTISTRAHTLDTHSHILHFNHAVPRLLRVDGGEQRLLPQQDGIGEFGRRPSYVCVFGLFMCAF